MRKLKFMFPIAKKFNKKIYLYTIIVTPHLLIHQITLHNAKEEC